VVETTIDTALETEAERDLAEGIAKRGGKLPVMFSRPTTSPPCAEGLHPLGSAALSVMVENLGVFARTRRDRTADVKISDPRGTPPPARRR
ncbi:hypothetical protein ACIKTA_10935, partial [Hansschlegelia beijingensis]